MEKGKEGLLEISSEHKLRSENLAFDIDVWYPILKEFTFRTEFIPLTKVEAKAILNYQHYAFNDRKNRLTSEDVKTLFKLQKRIAKCIKTQFRTTTSGNSSNSNNNNNNNNRKQKPKLFLRLCGRSPKDAEPFSRSTLLSCYQSTLQQLTETSEEEYNKLEEEYHLNLSPTQRITNNRLRAISKVHWLQVTQPEDAMSLLLTSERVFADLHDWMEWGEPEQIVLREWCDYMSLEFEFRAFIHNHQLNALSQYDHYCIYPSLFNLKPMIQEKIFQEWQKVHPKLSLSSYVMDFIYNPTSSSVRVIEISPFLPCTGAACFHWVNDADILYHGPFEFRLNTKLNEHMDELITSNWDDRWKKLPHNYLSTLKLCKENQSKRRVYISCAVLLGMIGVSTMISDFDIFFFLQYFVVFILFYISYQLISDKLKQRKKKKKLFVYGTLKSQFHWNKKYLFACKFIAKVKTRTPQHLVVGDSGVPYLLDDHLYFKVSNDGETGGCDQEGVVYEKRLGKIIEGELWEVDDIALEGLDEYEGLHKGYYIRKPVPVQRDHLFFKSYSIADAYFKTDYSAKLWNATRLSNYSLEFHREHYKPIKHILVKQEKYLSVPEAHLNS